MATFFLQIFWCGSAELAVVAARFSLTVSFFLLKYREFKHPIPNKYFSVNFRL